VEALLPPGFPFRQINCLIWNLFALCAFVWSSPKPGIAKGAMMLLLIAAALVVVWALAFVVFHVTAALIHLLLIVALVIGAIRLFQPRSPGDTLR
jgi:hypothetical protein